MRNNRTEASIGVSVLSGIILSIMAVLLGCAGTAALIVAEKVQMENVGYYVMGILFASSVIGTLVALQKAKKRYLLIGTVTGVGVFAIILIMGLLTFEGKMDGIWETLLLIVGTVIAVVLLRTSKTKRRNPRHRVGNSG